MSVTLEDVRKKIDALDDKIHDLLMERADLIVEVSEEKRRHKIPIVQPAREARMIRRLLARHRGPLPEAAIVKIWRELVGAVSLLQTGLKVSVAATDPQGQMWDMAKEYFGSILPMVRASAPMGAISAVREDEVSFAVVPWPQDGEPSPWWLHLMNADQNMRIVAAMPYGLPVHQGTGIQHRALVVSKTDYAPSGDDRSFIAAYLPRDVSRTRMIDVFKDFNLKVLGITTLTTNGSPETLHLVEVDDFIAPDDERLKKFADKFEGSSVRTSVIGGYPVPPVYKHARADTRELLKAAPSS